MAMMDPVLVWALVALAALAGLYDLGRRAIAGASKREIEDELKPIRQALDSLGVADIALAGRIEKLRAEFDAFVAEDAKTWDTVGAEWRKTVAELTEKVDGVTNAAKSEITGALSGLDAMAGTRKVFR